MVKRKRSQKRVSFARRVKRKIQQKYASNLLNSEGGHPTPPQTPSGARRVYHALTGAAGVAAGALSGPAAGFAVDTAAGGLEYAYDKLTQTDKARGNSKVSHMSSGTLAGKVKKPLKKVSRKLKGKYGMTKYAMSQKGITTREEFRKADTGLTANESRFIGHTSLPVRATYYNMFRAVIKMLMLKAGIHIDALTSITTFASANVPRINVKYYTSWQPLASLASNTWTPTGAEASGTWKVFCDAFADWILTLPQEDPRNVRWFSIELLPPAAYNSAGPQRIIVPLAQFKIHIVSKSMLKFQNQSGKYATETDVLQTDDLNNVPVEVNMYYVKGNQFINQNRKSSAAQGLNFLGFDETYVQNQIGSEPAPAYEITNCTGKSKVYMDPGHIKTSIISYRKSLSFGALMRMFVKKTVGTAVGWEFADDTYNKSLGHCRGIHVDRVIGSKEGQVRLLIELELQQQVACTGYIDTHTDQYEV